MSKTDREKLVELISDFVVHVPHEDGQTWEEACADHLLANGVTVQQWIPGSEPPEVWKTEDDVFVNYIVYTPVIGVDVGNYLKPANRWLCMGIPCEVTHWMPMPVPPKEALC